MRKLRLIAASELVGRDKLLYTLDVAGRSSGFVTYRLRGGAAVALRSGTTDHKAFDEIFGEGVYKPGLAALLTNKSGDTLGPNKLSDALGPVTLIDLGAYTGLSALFFARELAVEEIIAVEPDPDNFRLLSNNLRTSGLASRATAIHA